MGTLANSEDELLHNAWMEGLTSKKRYATQLLLICEHNYESFTKSFDSFHIECHLLITFANSLDPDQTRRSVGPDLDQNCLTL